MTIELKCARRSDDRIPFTKKRGMRRSQIKWIRENIRNGGTVWIIAEVFPDVFIIEGQYVDQINGKTRTQLHAISHRVIKRGRNKEAAAILHEVLTKPPGE